MKFEIKLFKLISWFGNNRRKVYKTSNQNFKSLQYDHYDPNIRDQIYPSKLVIHFAYYFFGWR